jgi:cysteine-rich repeat protein
MALVEDVLLATLAPPAYGYTLEGFSVADPTLPTSLGLFGPGQDVAVDGTIGVALSPACVLDLTNPRAPTVTPFGEYVSQEARVAVKGTIAYISAPVGSEDWLDVYDLSQATSPQKVASYAIESTPVRIQRQAGTLVMPLGRKRAVVVYDTTDPVRPQLVDRVATSDVPYAALQTQDHYFVASDDGLSVFRRTPCARVCGNSYKESGELCDDGNRLDGDECPADCGIAAP